jgi:hypothetical protein
LLVSATVPLVDPATVGANPTVSVAVWPGFKVSGKLTPEMVYPTPLTDPALTVTGTDPVEFSVTDAVPVAPNAIVPKFKLVALSASVGTAGPRFS